MTLELRLGNAVPIAWICTGTEFAGSHEMSKSRRSMATAISLGGRSLPTSLVITS